MSRLLCVAFALATLTGCGGQLTTAPVSGTITLNGEPLADASVTFTPAATGIEAPASNGRTDAGGNFTLEVTATGDRGAVLGKHVVTVARIEEEKEGEDADVIDPNADTSLPPHDLNFEVKAGENVANFNLGEAGA